MFQMGGNFVVALDTEGHLCSAIAGHSKVGFWPPAEAETFGGWSARPPGNTLIEVLETGENPIKISFSNFTF